MLDPSEQARRLHELPPILDNREQDDFMSRPSKCRFSGMRLSGHLRRREPKGLGTTDAASSTYQ
jgi:hypothetical protein